MKMDQSDTQNPQQMSTPQPPAQDVPIVPPQMDASSQVTDPELKAYLEQVEKTLLDEIVDKLKKKEITVEESQKTAQDFLALLPPTDQKDLLTKLYALSRKHPKEGLPVYLKYAEPEFIKERDQTLEKLAVLIHEGKIDEAVAVAKEQNT